MMVRPEVVDYLKAHSGRFSDVALRQRLIHDGVPASEVDRAFAIISLTQARPLTITDRGRSAKESPLPQQRATPQAPIKKGASILKRIFVFALSTAILSALFNAPSLLKKLGTPEFQQKMAALLGQQASEQRPDPAQAQAYAQKKKSSENFQTRAQMAYRSLTRGDNAGAARFASEALAGYDAKLHGEDNKKAVLGMRARAYELSGQTEDALNDYQRLANMDPQAMEPLAGRARIFTAGGDFPAAAQEAARMILAAPKRPEGYAAAAEAASRQRDAGEARKRFTQAIRAAEASGWRQSKPQYLGNFYFNRGALYANIRDLRQAVKDISRAIALDPDQKQYFEVRAKLYRAMGKEAQAQLDQQSARNAVASTGPDLALGANLPMRKLPTATYSAQ
jgi:tetratricopeptide (TPR) repeat protein